MGVSYAIYMYRKINYSAALVAAAFHQKEQSNENTYSTSHLKLTDRTLNSSAQSAQLSGEINNAPISWVLIHSHQCICGRLRNKRSGVINMVREGSSRYKINVAKRMEKGTPK